VICIKLDEAKIGFRKGLGGRKKVKSPKPFFLFQPSLHGSISWKIYKTFYKLA
jgi:hypothetical protein